MSDKNNMFNLIRIIAESNDAQDRIDAIVELASFENEESEKVRIDLLFDENPAVRATASGTLTTFIDKGEKSLPALMKVIKDDDSNVVRRSAMDTLTSVWISPTMMEKIQESFPLLLEVMLHDPTRSIQGLAYRTIAKIAEKSDTFSKIGKKTYDEVINLSSNSQDPIIRRRAVDLLGFFRIESTSKFLKEQLEKEEEGIVKNHIVKAIARNLKENSLSYLAELKKKTKNPYVKGGVSEAYGILDKVEFQSDIISDLLNNPDDIIRLCSAKALGEFKTSNMDVLRALEKAKDTDVSEIVQNHAYFSFEKLTCIGCASTLPF